MSKTFSLEVDFKKEDSYLGILGASGSGKSMTLKCIAGVEMPDEGHISVDGKVLYDSAAKINLRPQARRVGYMFQDYALFPQMTVVQNICCGAPDKKNGAAPFISRFGLEGLEGRFPHQLSGGQRQRVALARMLAANPQTILLDEPFSALDEHLRQQTRMQLLDALHGFRDVIIVTHSRSEAYEMCGEMAVMQGGRLLAKDGTKQLFQDPGTVAVARLTGCKNISPISKISDYELEALNWNVRLHTQVAISDKITHIGIRAHELTPIYGKPQNMENVFPVLIGQQLESVFEYNIMCENAVHPTSEPLWWTAGKSGFSGMPDYLHAPPLSILLLSEN